MRSRVGAATRRGREAAISLVILAGCNRVASFEGRPTDASVDAAAFDAGAADDDGSSADATTDAPADVTTLDVVTTFDAGAVCAPPPPDPVLPPAQVAAGTRLVPRLIADVASGGVEMPRDIYDNALGTTCTPARLADGTMRCVPSVHYLTAKRYADAAKTQPVTLEPLASPPPTGALVALLTGSVFDGAFSCTPSSVEHLGRVGALLSGGQYYDQFGDLGTAPTGYGVFAIAPETTPLALLHEVRTRYGGKIAVRELHGDDGSRLFATDFWDTLHDVAVTIQSDAPGGPRCLPPRAEHPAVHGAPPPNGVVTDAWCAIHDEFFATSSCGPTPPFVTAPGGVATYSVELQSRTVYSCNYGSMEGPRPPPILATSTQSVLAPCASIPLADWAAATLTTVGAGRLTAEAYVIEGMTFPRPVAAGPILDRPFVDTTLGVSCMAMDVDDGALRCLPTSALTIAYADSACTNPIAATLGGVGTPLHAYGGSKPSWSFPGTQGIVHVVAIGTARAVGNVYWRTPIGCSLVGSIASFELGASVSPSVFAEMEIRAVSP